LIRFGEVDTAVQFMLKLKLPTRLHIKSNVLTVTVKLGSLNKLSDGFDKMDGLESIKI